MKFLASKRKIIRPCPSTIAPAAAAGFAAAYVHVLAKQVVRSDAVFLRHTRHQMFFSAGRCQTAFPRNAKSTLAC
jgi:hypothetical protein